MGNNIIPKIPKVEFCATRPTRVNTKPTIIPTN
jgi:hypothetical protein